jgi:hypothetical protein
MLAVSPLVLVACAGDEDGHEEMDVSGQAFIGEFGVILHTAPARKAPIVTGEDEMPTGGGSTYGDDGDDDKAEGGDSYGGADAASDMIEVKGRRERTSPTGAPDASPP